MSGITVESVDPVGRQSRWTDGVLVGLVAAAISPQAAWEQPLLRLTDTVVGIALGVACKWIGSFLFFRFIGERAR